MASLMLRWRKGQLVSLATVLHATALLLLCLRAVRWLGAPTQVTDVVADARLGGRLSAPHEGGRIFANVLRGRHDVRVYVYQLPPKFNTLQVARSHQQPAPIRDPFCDTNFYSAEVAVHEGLLRSRARTRDPREADFFYVPVYVTCFLINNHPNNLTKTGMFFDEAMEYVTHKFPFFNVSQGRDHVYTFAQGFGARLSGDNWRNWRNGIFLTHNGDFSSEEYTPRKDIVIPPNLASYIKPVYADKKRRNSLILERRRFLAQFGGQSFSSSITDHRGSNYSGGVRQYLASSLYDTPGFRITGTRSDDYLEDMHDSMFCLAPEGWHPWSPRPYYAILLGCVPVVLSDRQELAFEDAIPYDDFVVWVRPNDVFHLNAILRAIPAEDILRRLRIMERIWMLYWYPSGTGAALEAILGELSRHKYSSRPKRHYESFEHPQAAR